MLRFLLFFLLVSTVAPAMSVYANDLSPAPTPVVDRVVSIPEQDVSYDVGFLWLDKVAVANFKLQKSTRPGMYIASLSAKMVGIAASLTNNRKQQYVSMMRLMPDGSFRSVRHTSQIEKGGTIRAKVYLFDYDNGEVSYQYFKNNKLVDEEKLSINGNEFPSDVLTTYFNLVVGAYGPMEVGARYEVPAFSKKGIGKITIDFLPSEIRPKKKFFSKDLLMCRVQVDQEVFDTKDGVIFIGYNKNRLPARGVVADILGIGDVRGVMK